MKEEIKFKDALPLGKNKFQINHPDDHRTIFYDEDGDVYFWSHTKEPIVMKDSILNKVGYVVPDELKPMTAEEIRKKCFTTKGGRFNIHEFGRNCAEEGIKQGDIKYKPFVNAVVEKRAGADPMAWREFALRELEKIKLLEEDD
jgi:hypothetical protein